MTIQTAVWEVRSLGRRRKAAKKELAELRLPKPRFDTACG